MIVREIGKGTYLVRHWWRWYRVQRGGAKWQRLRLKRHNIHADGIFDLDSAIQSINAMNAK